MYRFLGPLRPRLRAAFFRFFEQALSTDDGKRALMAALGGMADGARPPLPMVWPAPPYPDVGRRRYAFPEPRAVFVSARFRSGSTLVWNLFRHLPECVAFYEPLNERRWFDSNTRGTHVDVTHRGVTDYWREYDGLPDLARWYQRRWIDRDLYMDHRSWDPDLLAYLRALVAAAGTRRAVLQDNRIDFRLPWLRHHFPDARLIHLYRHPRDQWISTLLNPARVPRACTVAEFEAHDHYYLLSWARDLCHRFPCLDPRRAEHPYDLFYMLWRLSWAFGRQFADVSICFEDLCARPAQEVPRLFAAAGLTPADPEVAVRIVDPVPASRWTIYAPADWFEAREAQCDTILQDAVAASRTAITDTDETADVTRFAGREADASASHRGSDDVQPN